MLSNGPTWTSPRTKTEYSRRPALRAATIASFNVADIENARARVATSKLEVSKSAQMRKLVRSTPKTVVEEKTPEQKEIESLKAQLQQQKQANETLQKQFDELNQERDEEHAKFTDHLNTKMREAYRLKNDLRVMIERAQGYKDDCEGAQQMVQNLRKSLYNAEKLAKEEESRMQAEIGRLASNQSDLMYLYNKSVAEQLKQKRILETVQQRCAALQRENDELQERVEEAVMKGTHLTIAMSQLIEEGDQCAKLSMQLHMSSE